MSTLGNKKVMSNNIRQQMDLRGMSVKQLSDSLNLKYTTVIDWVNGKTYPRIDKIELMANFFGINKSDLIENYTGGLVKEIVDIASKLNEPRQSNVLNYANAQLNEQDNHTAISNIGKPLNIVTGRATAAGAPLNGNDQDAAAVHTLIDGARVPSGADELVTVDGDSMEPLLHKGSQVFIHYQPTVENGEIAIVHIKDTGVTCKKVYVDGCNVTLVSLNEAYEDMHFSADEVNVIGKVLL